MARRSRGHGGIRLHRSYTVAEAARALCRCRLTIRRWINEGLPIVSDRKPALILGADLIDFLSERKPEKRRCEPHELFCFSCRQPRPPAFEELELRPHGRAGGNLRALCGTCATVMHERVSQLGLAAILPPFRLSIVEVHEDLVESRNPCLNDHSPEEG